MEETSLRGVSFSKGKLCPAAKRIRDWLLGRMSSLEQMWGIPEPGHLHGLDSFLRHAHLASEPRPRVETMEPGNFPLQLCLESEGGGNVGGRQEVRSPASINPGPRSWSGACSPVHQPGCLWRWDIDQREHGREGDGCPRAAEGDGKARKAASIGQHLFKAGPPWVGHGSAILHPPADRIINAAVAVLGISTMLVSAGRVPVI